MASNMIEEKAELTAQELELMEQEAKAMEEADAKAVAEARAKKAARKRKARIRKLIIFLIVVAVGGVSFGSYYLKQQAEEAEAAALTEVTVEEGQEAVYAQITEIYGNEITYTVLKESESQPTSGGGEAAEGVSPEAEASVPENAEAENEEAKKAGPGEMASDGQGRSGGRSQGSDISSALSEGMPSGDMSSMVTIDNVAYELTEETLTVQIPVGTDVITKLGATTTFAKLSSGDNIALIMQDKEIVKVYIVE